MRMIIHEPGDLLRLTAFTYVTIMRLPAPATLGPTLQDLREIKAHGHPYTRNPLRIKLMLEPAVVKSNVNKWLQESLGHVKQIVERSNITLAELNIAKIARSQVWRPDVDCGGCTPFELAAPLQNCDTKSHDDFNRITERIDELTVAADPQVNFWQAALPTLPPAMQAKMEPAIAAGHAPVAVVERGDGQSTIGLGTKMLLDPEGTSNVVNANGDWHSSGHFIFAGNEGFHKCKYDRTKAILGKTAVAEHNKSIEEYHHVMTHVREDYVGTLSYFLLDVTNPPPSLLLDDHETYLSRLKSAGAIAAFQSMKLVGCPASHYQLAGRMGDGDRVMELHGLSFHACRAWAYKPVEVRVLLNAFLSTEATHPSVSRFVKDTAFFNWLGRKGSYMYVDRAVETVHKVQGERTGKFVTFDSAFQFTEHMPTMLHVLHALDVADNGESSAHDPLRQSTINAADAVRKDLKQQLGTDLTIVDDKSPLYGSADSNPTVVGTTAVRSHRPWEFLWRVAEGQSTGEGRAKPARWDKYVDHWLANNSPIRNR